MKFEDGLIFNPSLAEWDYCTKVDRRFYTERLQGIAPSDHTQIVPHVVPKRIPTGTYDALEGYYNPTDDWIYSYEGIKIREPGIMQLQNVIPSFY
jgi:hypothetical protein